VHDGRVEFCSILHTIGCRTYLQFALREEIYFRFFHTGRFVQVLRLPHGEDTR
jgi:hypothetical protein